MTMGLIGCRSCVEPSCSGCNLYELEKALRKGYFDAMKVRGGLHICAEVAEVVRCKDCELWNEWDEAGHKKLGNYVCSCAYFSNEDGYMVYTGPDDYCSHGERKEGQR